MFLRNLLTCFINGNFAIKSASTVINLKTILINIYISNKVAISINLTESIPAVSSILIFTSPTTLLVKLFLICASSVSTGACASGVLFTSSVANKVSEFQTLQTAAPILTTSVEYISITSATANGQITSDGGSSITEYGIVYSTSHNPTISNTKIKSNICDSTGLFTCELTNLKKQTTYYVRAYAINEKGTAYGNEVSFKADYQYVDLGLSVKWATCNVGANKPEETGDYFAWGETEPKDYYDWSNYKWCKGYRDELTKYCDYDSYGIVDKIYVLQLSDDAARVNWGGNWRMPLKSELDELYNSCTWTSTTQNGTKGHLVTGKNGNSIFLPKAGYKSEGSLTDLGAYGYYWSSTVYSYWGSAYPYQACAYRADGEEKIARRCGLPIRPVCQ